MIVALLQFLKLGKQTFCFVILSFCYPCLFVTSLRAETKEIYLPFPETWNDPIQNATSENKTTQDPTLNQKITDQNPSSLGNPSQTINPGSNRKLMETPNPKGQELGINGNSKAEAVAISAKPDSKKNKKKEVIDPSKASYQKGKAYLSRDQKQSAEQEFASSYSKEGDAAKYSRVENTNLFGLDGKDKESSGLVEKQEDPDLKIKTQFELARSLDRIGNPESEEKAYKEYLKLVTEFPKHPELTPRSHYAMATLLIRKKEYRSALHQLVAIIKNFKESEEFLPAHHYLGKVYESSWDERDLERSLKYYQLYLNGVEGKSPKPGYDFRKETRERLRVLGSAI